MDGFRFVPLDRCEVVPAQVESVVGLLHDAPRMAQADAFVLVREESWAAAPFYYVFGHEELGHLLGSADVPNRRPDP